MMDRRPLPTLSICLRCRDGREAAHGDMRGGARLAEAVCGLVARQGCEANLRGVRCMSQCKRSCVVSLTAPGAFTYVFGDLDPKVPDHAKAILDLIPRYRSAPEGFLARDARPAPLRASILGRLPPIGTNSELVTELSLAVPAGTCR
jgi:predicted metal-binding protein